MDLEEHEAGVRPASLPLRGLAFLLDWAIILVLTVFIAGGGDADVGTRLPVLLIVASIYVVGFTVGVGSTPGKMAFRMKITDEQGKRLEPDKAVLRSVAFLIGVFLLFIGFFVSVFLALSDPRRRTLHDRLAGSLVVWA